MLLISVLKVFLHLRVLCLPKVKMGAAPCRETGAFWCIWCILVQVVGDDVGGC